VGETVVEHAKTCVLNGKLYVYYADEKQNIGVIFNNIFQLMGLAAGSGDMPVVGALREREGEKESRTLSLEARPVARGLELVACWL